MTLRADFVRDHPDFPLLSLDDPDALQSFLIGRGWIEADEPMLRCERAGDGNMNLTLRVQTAKRGFVLKQARPWVEKYDDIPAPWDRSHFERRFYERARDLPGVAERMPKLIHADSEARILVLEDLVDATDMTSVYDGDPVTQAELDVLAGYLASLHRGRFATAEDLQTFANREMRSLNHEHIFRVPLAEGNGIDLDALEPGLADAADALRADPRYRALAEATGDLYQRDGSCLVHGDYFPGSWLRTSDGVRVIDPEFAFPGDPEVDIACAAAHLALGAQPISSAQRLVRSYAQARDASLDPTRLARYAAAEVMRRLIGVAQLPLPTARPGPVGPRTALLLRSRDAMLAGDLDRLWPAPG